MSFPIAGLVAVAWIVAASGATTHPATAPASRPSSAPASGPALPPLDPRGTVDVVIPNAPLAMRVPRGWRSLNMQSDIARGWMVPPAPTNVHEAMSMFRVVALTDEHSDLSLEQLVEMDRALIQKTEKQVKMLRDEKIAFAGGDAWLLEFEHQRAGQLRDSRGRSVDVWHDARTRRIISVRGRWRASLDFTCAPHRFDQLLRNVQRVMDTFKWKE